VVPKHPFRVARGFVPPLPLNGQASAFLGQAAGQPSKVAFRQGCTQNANSFPQEEPSWTTPTHGESTKWGSEGDRSESTNGHFSSKCVKTSSHSVTSAVLAGRYCARLAGGSVGTPTRISTATALPSFIAGLNFQRLNAARAASSIWGTMLW
jgi:hypothetical protein